MARESWHVTRHRRDVRSWAEIRTATWGTRKNLTTELSDCGYYHSDVLVLKTTQYRRQVAGESTKTRPHVNCTQSRVLLLSSTICFTVSLMRKLRQQRSHFNITATKLYIEGLRATQCTPLPLSFVTVLLRGHAATQATPPRQFLKVYFEVATRK